MCDHFRQEWTNDDGVGVPLPCAVVGCSAGAITDRLVVPRRRPPTIRHGFPPGELVVVHEPMPVQEFLRVTFPGGKQGWARAEVVRQN